MVMAALLSEFAAENLPAFKDDDLKANAAAVDWESPKASLLRHSGVAKSVRIVASIAAQSQAFELRIYERLYFDRYVAECELEISQTTDPVRRQKLESALSGTRLYHDATPVCRAELHEYAKIRRRNIEFVVNGLLEFCRKIVADWLEFLPAESVRDLQAQLEQLASATLSARLTWFGLADFAPSGQLPETTT
jgi:hypothetical protein